MRSSLARRSSPILVPALAGLALLTAACSSRSGSGIVPPLQFVLVDVEPEPGARDVASDVPLALVF